MKVVSFLIGFFPLIHFLPQIYTLANEIAIKVDRPIHLVESDWLLIWFTQLELKKPTLDYCSNEEERNTAYR